MNAPTQPTPMAEAPVNGVFKRWTMPDSYAIVLDDKAAAVANAALSAVEVCTNLLAHRESERDDDQPALCTLTTHGLLAAVACAAELLRLQLGGDGLDGVFCLKGDAAKTVLRTTIKADYEASTRGGDHG